ncbi:FAD-dependent monooxygenase [Allokutzneria albata]|uniref:2-polyprenyl-6-methoxyphenol hydroxylase n=1 Tax=Allokutzneria albata TaxID=211114 RepID=A0A1G9UL17_ALLAB|nr:FAD-dependent monooxygenase [Allokutzneria albata]SDM60524.1 2-polyprenyl-6-methoxyphenol hydroxylase [Allokutzneria albata]
MTKNVLISGASVAGPALAYWLRRRGFEVTVVERAPALRTGGQAIDVRGVALDVLDRMGLLERARELRTTMRGMQMLDGQGNEVMRSTEMALSSGRFDSGDIELLREDLTSLLYELTRDDVEYVFGDTITGIDGTEVTFENGPPRRFDVVVGADGLHSGVRALAFGPESQFLRHLGTYLAVFSTENFLGLDNWQVWLHGEEAGYAVYPVRDNSELRVTLGVHADSLPHDRRDNDAHRRMLAAKLDGLGWETPKLVEAMWEAEDFYFDAMAQIHMDTWSSGRVTLVGDAGYCASPLSGQGTSLALVGAYVLAEELERADGQHAEGFAAYEARMRPFARLNQALATENPGQPASEESLERAKTAISLDSQEKVSR